MGADFVGFLAVGVAVKCGWPGGRGAAILQVGGSPCAEVGGSPCAEVGGLHRAPRNDRGSLASSSQHAETSRTALAETPDAQLVL